LSDMPEVAEIHYLEQAVSIELILHLKVATSILPPCNLLNRHDSLIQEWQLKRIKF
jgi:hypothetical protein